MESRRRKVTANIYTNLGLHRRCKLSRDDSSANGDCAVAEGVLPQFRTPDASCPLPLPEGTKTNTMQNNPIQDRKDTETQPCLSAPPSASSSSPRRQVAMQKESTGCAQPQATAPHAATGRGAAVAWTYKQRRSNRILNLMVRPLKQLSLEIY